MSRAAYLQDFDEWPFIYGFRLTSDFALNQVLGQNIALPFNGDADFIWRGLSSDTSVNADFQGQTPGDAQDFQFRLTDPSGAGIFAKDVIISSPVTGSAPLTQLPYWGRAFAQGVNLTTNGHVQNQGMASALVPIIPERLVRNTSAFFTDFAAMMGGEGFGTLWLELAFHGVKLYPKNSRFAIDRKKNYRVLPFTYVGTLSGTTAGQNFTNNIIPLAGDSAFLLYGVQAMGQLAGGFGGVQSGGIQFTFYGPNGETTSARAVDQTGVAAPQQLLAAGNCLGTSRRPRLLCPPIAYPAGGQIVFDYRVPSPAPSIFSNIAGAPFEVAFVGVKLYPVRS